MATILPRVVSRDNASTKVPYAIRDRDVRRLHREVVKYCGNQEAYDVVDRSLDALFLAKKMGVHEVSESAFAAHTRDMNPLEVAIKTVVAKHHSDNFEEGQSIDDEWSDSWNTDVSKMTIENLTAKLATETGIVIKDEYSLGDDGIAFIFEHTPSGVTYCRTGKFRDAVLDLLKHSKTLVPELITTQEAFGDEIERPEPLPCVDYDEPDVLDLMLEHERRLEVDRQIRRSVSARNKYKSITTPDGTTYGTYWKFEAPIESAVNIDPPENHPDRKKIVLLGVGKSPTSGQFLAAHDKFGGEFKLVCWDPDIEPSLWLGFQGLENIDIRDYPFDPGQPDHLKELDDAYMVISDIAVGLKDSFASDYTHLMQDCIQSHQCDVGIPHSITKFRMHSRVACGTEIFTGRYHNDEGFCLYSISRGPPMYPDRGALADLLKLRSKYSRLRNAYIFYPLLQVKVAGEYLDKRPVPPRPPGLCELARLTGGILKPNMTTNYFCEVFSQSGVKLDAGSPVSHLIGQVMLLSSLVPSCDISSLVPNADSLLTSVLTNSRQQLNRKRVRGDNPNHKVRASRASTLVLYRKHSDLVTNEDAEETENLLKTVRQDREETRPAFSLSLGMKSEKSSKLEAIANATVGPSREQAIARLDAMHFSDDENDEKG